MQMDDHSVGFRFYPTESELVSFYLANMLQGRIRDMHRVIPVVNVFENEPWELPKHAGERCRTDIEQWFFFVPRQEREVRGGRPSRTTSSGYWKATGSPSYVFSSENRIIGIRKMMVFYRGKAPTGRKTNWKMNEYKAFDGEVNMLTNPKLRHEYSLCRVYVTSGNSRAFDRRPTGASRQAKLPSNVGASTSSQATVMTEKESSSQTLSSGEDGIAGNTRETNLDMVDGLEEPFWDWEQLNWT